MINGHELNLLLLSLAAMIIIRDVNAKSEPSPSLSTFTVQVMHVSPWLHGEKLPGY